MPGTSSLQNCVNSSGAMAPVPYVSRRAKASSGGPGKALLRRARISHSMMSQDSLSKASSAAPPPVSASLRPGAAALALAFDFDDATLEKVLEMMKLAMRLHACRSPSGTFAGSDPLGSPAPASALGCVCQRWLNRSVAAMTSRLASDWSLLSAFAFSSASFMPAAAPPFLLIASPRPGFGSISSSDGFCCHDLLCRGLFPLPVDETARPSCCAAVCWAVSSFARSMVRNVKGGMASFGCRLNILMIASLLAPRRSSAPGSPDFGSGLSMKMNLFGFSPTIL
mmetsp:Transcript_51931/g.155110  ORF Transcript_51931/g.155110 Transcript_51931/m.155110 type:complete len:282 (+) Transcript_51931:323-1168(+)